MVGRRSGFLLGARLIFRGELLVLGRVYIWKLQLPVADISGNWKICGVFSLRSQSHDPVYYPYIYKNIHDTPIQWSRFFRWVQWEILDIAKVRSSTGPHRPVNASICRARIYNRLQELMRAEWGPETGGFCGLKTGQPDHPWAPTWMGPRLVGG